MTACAPLASSSENVLTSQSWIKKPAISGMAAPIVKATQDTNAAYMHASTSK